MDNAVNCAICLEPTAHDQPHTLTSCNHRFHHACLAEWLVGHVRCPVCRMNLGDPDNEQEGEGDEAGGVARTTLITVNLPNHWSDGGTDFDRVFDFGAQLALNIQLGTCPRNWKQRTAEWTSKMKASGQRGYLLRADVIGRGVGKPPHLVYIEACPMVGRGTKQGAMERRDTLRTVPRARPSKAVKGNRN